MKLTMKKLIRRVASRQGSEARERDVRWVRSIPGRWIRALLLRRWVWLALVGGVAITTGLVVGSITADALEERAAWGTLVPVAVAAQPVAIGDLLAETVVWHDYPQAVVPQGAVTSLAADEVAAAAIGPGEMIVERDVRTGSLGLGAQLGPGRSAMALPRSAGWPDLLIGDHVQLLGTSASLASHVVADGAIVMQADDDGVTVSITSAEAQAVADALSRGSVVAVLVPFS